MGSANGNGLSEAEEALLATRPSHQQREIFDAQDAWDEALGRESRPCAGKLDEMLEILRDRGYRGNGDALGRAFVLCCTTTAACRSLRTTEGQAFDPVAWQMGALKEGRYPPRTRRTR